MKIALLGYGKMGHEVEAVAAAAGHEVVARFDLDSKATPEALAACDVAIDFSEPAAVESNARLVTQARRPLVIGTTGWERSHDTVKQMVLEAGTGCVFASNFSIGVNLFLDIVREAARLFDAAGYDAYVEEAHHRAKKDYPSGTALRIADAVMSGMKSKKQILTALEQGMPIAKDALQVTSIRAGFIPGTHTIGFEGDDDTVELTHRARSRRGFASGAVRAAEWIVTRKGFYRFEEQVDAILGITK